ncbi:transmembrane protein 203 isoform X2 [Narcine bancroftii]|uniref:transmembrane protein 203 isoform X2 n=1 Tax=Narcine bancroftii TaxID=1343680 RepID=UPI0038314148
MNNGGWPIRGSFPIDFPLKPKTHPQPPDLTHHRRPPTSHGALRRRCGRDPSPQSRERRGFLCGCAVILLSASMSRRVDCWEEFWSLGSGRSSCTLRGTENRPLEENSSEESAPKRNCGLWIANSLIHPGCLAGEYSVAALWQHYSSQKTLNWQCDISV